MAMHSSVSLFPALALEGARFLRICLTPLFVPIISTDGNGAGRLRVPRFLSPTMRSNGLRVKGAADLCLYPTRSASRWS